MTDDVELVKRFVGGDQAAFDELVDRYEQTVYAIAYRMCGTPDDARDVSQEVFISAFRALKKYRHEAQLGTWFHRVAVNASLDRLRSRARRSESPLEAAGEPAAHTPGPEELGIAAERAVHVHRALAQLSDEYRAVLVLHDLHDLDYAAVAASLDIPLGTVKSRIHRARAEMASLLGYLKAGEPEPSPDPLRDR